MPEKPKQLNPNLHEDVQRAGAMMPSSVDLEAGTMQAVISAESRVDAWDSRYGYVQRITLSDGIKFREGDKVPFLDTHNQWELGAVLGSARGLQVRDAGDGRREAVATIHFDKRQKGQDALGLYADGHVTDVSIRFQYDLKKTVVIEAGQTKRVGEREFTAGELPLLVVKQSVVTEVSGVGIGADPKARAQSEGWEAAGLREKENEQMKVEEKQAEQNAAPPAPTAQPSPSNVVDMQAEREKIQRETRAQVTEIQSLGRKLGVEDSVIQSAIDRGLTAEQASKHFIEEHAKSAKPLPQNVAQQNVSDAERMSVQAIAGGLVASMGDGYAQALYERESKLSKSDGEQAEKMIDRGRKFWRGIGLQGALFAGVELATGKRVYDVREALRLAQQSLLRESLGLVDVSQSGGLSGASLSYIFDVGINTVVMNSFAQAPETYSKWTRRRPCKNYLTQERVGLQHTSRIRRRAEGTAAKHNTFSDKKETYKVYEYAGQIVMDQQAFINDDLGMLLALGQYEGQAARRVVGDAAYTPLMTNPTMADTKALFHADHRNLSTSGSAISAANIEAVYAKMAGQYLGSGKDKVNLNIPGKYIITGVTKAPTAWKEINSQVILKTGGSSVTAFAPENILTRYGLEVIAEARISNGFVNPVTDEVIDGDANVWFMACDPMQGETVELGFIEALGEEPLVTSEVLTGGMFGLRYVVQITVGAGVNAFEGLQKATGAS